MADDITMSIKAGKTRRLKTAERWNESDIVITADDSFLRLVDGTITTVEDDSVASVRDYAFHDCSNLTSVTLNNAETVGEGAFVGCNSLTSVYAPKAKSIDMSGVTNIKQGVLKGCSSLESLVLPFVGDSVKTPYDNYQYPMGYIFGTSSYSGATATSQTYYGQLQSAEDGGLTSATYYIPTALKSVTVNGGEILKGAFSNCKNLTSIHLGDNVDRIINRAFVGCSALECLTVTDNNPNFYSIDNCIIETASGTLIVGCKGSVIPADGGVTSIGSYAFEDTPLTSITIPDSVTSIGYYAFYGCKSLTSVIIGNSVTSIDQRAFWRCPSLTSITIPDSVTSIGADAFDDCTSLKSVYITDIGAWCGISFADSSSNPCYNHADLYLNGEKLTELVIPDTVTSIKDYAFNRAPLTSVTIPDSVTSIGGWAFWYCKSLTSITIPDSVTSIGQHAFYCCDSLTSITYGGTKAQWEAIEKYYNWNSNTGRYTIHCTDGDITK